MNALSENTTFRLFGGTFKVDYINGSMTRFHREGDTYDVYELESSWLLDKMRSGRLKVVLNGS